MRAVQEVPNKLSVRFREKGVVQVEGYYRFGYIRETNTKNESSKRIVSVPSSTMALLKKYKAHQAQEKLKVGDLWNDTNRLFVAWNGLPMYPETISQWYVKFIKRHRLKRITFHGLRHTAATLLIGKGVGDRIVSSLLGHADNMQSPSRVQKEPPQTLWKQ